MALCPRFVSGERLASPPQQGAVAAHPALQQQDDCQEEEPRKEQEGPRPRRARAVRVLSDVFMGSKGGVVVAQARKKRGGQEGTARGEGRRGSSVRACVGCWPCLTSQDA